MIIMGEFSLSKEFTNFEILISIDFNENKDIIFEEYSNGKVSLENPSNLRNYSYCCNDSDFEEWNNFFTDFMYLYESDELINHIKNLENKDNSYFFTDENITLKRL